MKVVAVLFTALIAVSALFYSATNYEMTGHLHTIERDNLLITLIGTVLVFAVGAFLWFVVKKNTTTRLEVFAWIVIVWYLIVGEYMAFFGRSMPNSDSWIVYAMAKQMASGDLSIIDATGSYMSYYPQQIGICAFLSLLIRFINLFPITIEEFHFLMAGYAAMECVTVFFLYKTVDIVFRSNKVSFVFLYLSIFNLPYIMYSSYLYGEVPALMFFSIGAYCIAGLFAREGRPILDIIFSVICLSLAVWVRKNTLILIIGVLIVLVFEFFKTSKAKFLITAILVGTCAFSILPVTVKYYENKSGGALTTGVTALSYIAMGMQESELDINPGWYTGFNITTFENSGCNPSLANEIAKEEIKTRKAEFLSNPKYAFSFYKSKFLTQWTEGTYFSRESTHVYYGDRSKFLMSIYYGEYGKYYVLVCNVFQSIVFIGAFLWALLQILGKSKGELWKSFIFIGIFGGFLFHMMWEANSRYIITYACLLIPYAAAGIGNVFGGIKRKN